MVSASMGKKPQVAPYSGAMLAMVARSARVQVVQAVAVELDELADHALGPQHLHHGEHQVGGGGPLGSCPVSLKPTTSGISMEIGWPSMAASASMPPTPQPSTRGR
jgi:hypothetical protein